MFLHFIYFRLGPPDTKIRSTALGAAILAGAAIKFCGWDISNPETLAEVNTKGSQKFTQSIDGADKEKRWLGWKRAVERSMGWAEATAEDD